MKRVIECIEELKRSQEQLRKKEKESNPSVVLVGRTASGKDTLKKELLKEEGYYSVVCDTTRPKRDGEEEGLDYNYISEIEYLERLSAGEYYEESKYYETSYKGDSVLWLYGTPNKKESGKKVIILDPEGAKEYKEKYKEVSVYYLDVNKEEREKRYKRRKGYETSGDYKRREETDDKLYSEEKIREIEGVVILRNKSKEEALEELKRNEEEKTRK